MAIVAKSFTYYDDGISPTVHAVGEEVFDEVEAFAISQGFTEVEEKTTSGRRGKK